MPQCSHCQTPYEQGQRYCSGCGSFLFHPLEGDTFCPQCGIRVSPRQEFCHECDTPLKGAAAAMAALGPEPAPEQATPDQAAAGAPAKGLQPWIMGLAIGAIIIVLIAFIMLYAKSTPAPAPPPPGLKGKAPAAAPAPALKEQLQTALSTLREGQMKKDITLFMSAHALTFPELDQKRVNALKAWENYDYTNLAFTIDKIQNLDQDNAVAEVTWHVDTRNRRTQELSSTNQTYQVRFAKEMGKWRIRSLEEK